MSALVNEDGIWEVVDNVNMLIQPSQAWINANQPGPTLLDVQQAKITQIETAYTTALNTSFPTTALGTSVTFNYGPADQTKFSKLTSSYLAGITPYPFPITDTSGTIQSFTTPAQIKQLLIDIQTFEMGLEVKLQTMSQEVKAATTVDQVNAIVVQF